MHHVAERLVLIEDLASPMGGLAAFGVAGVLVPVRGTTSRPFVLAVLVLLSTLAALAGGARAGLLTAAVAVCSFDFLHEAPYGLLSPGWSDRWVWCVLGAGAILGAVLGRPARRRQA